VIDGRRDTASHPRGSAIDPDDFRRREVAQVTSGGRIPRPLATGTAGSDTSLRAAGSATGSDRPTAVVQGAKIIACYLPFAACCRLCSRT